LTWRDPRMIAPLLMMVVMLSLVQLVGVGDTRLRLPSEPVIMMFTALGVVNLRQRTEH